ncbi:hypothetical protein KIN20_035142 [Parelaphostrongylus tenuis]|uniref:Post-GPI attachment to proteins factor 3 n=1 Tax=Parelaphostrongylus tenuis TaxID=148309 RepID=A0AAD5RB61_PARTN|nr:hypothetical protein KIN20_035142 [Parelaphostrongylus tenuis]
MEILALPQQPSRSSHWSSVADPMEYVLLSSCMVEQVLSSRGDLSMHYRSCTDQCRSKYSCPERFDSCAWCRGPCFRCRYNCMWESADDFLKRGESVQQFHGKWPFIAIDISILAQLILLYRNQLHLSSLC